MTNGKVVCRDPPSEKPNFIEERGGREGKKEEKGGPPPHPKTPTKTTHGN